jgi:DNA-binding transcriptional LysR family regulator
LRAFEAVARLGTVTAAAVELGRTHGAVSKQLRALHTEVQVPLLEKAGTGLRLTAAGRQLAQAVSECLAGLGDAYDSIINKARSPDVHVACSSTFAMAWLVPNLRHFSEANPGIRVRLTMMSAKEIQEELEADLVVARDPSAYPFLLDREAIPLAPARFAVLAAPDYPFEWKNGALAVGCRIDHDHSTQSWDDWAGATDVRLAAASTLSFPHTYLCLSAAASRLGVAMVEERLAWGELQSGRVVPLTDFVSVENGFVAIPHATKPISESCVTFLDWLRVEMRKPIST